MKVNKQKPKFKLNKVKWTWAPTVQRKEIYRDDEFIRTKSKERALDAIDFLMAKNNSVYSYTITVCRNGEYFTYWRHSMPCLGGLAKYADSHGPRYFMNPYFPRDIKVAFPEGDIIFISCHMKEQPHTPLHEFVLSKESPWVSAFGSRDTILFRKRHFILTNMDTDPTVFYSMMKISGFPVESFYVSRKYPDWDPKAQLLAMLFDQADPRRLAGQKPLRISGGTWSQGYGYTRPFNESIFKTSIDRPFKDFSKSTGYLYANFQPNYFINKMKEFGVMVELYKGTPIPVNSDSERALVQAWDYFKKQAAKLPYIPGKVFKD